MNLGNVTRNLRLYGKAERLLLEARAKQAARKGFTFGLALVFAGIGFVFLNVALYALLTTLWGPVWAPAALGLANLALAGLAAVVAQSTRPSAELQLAEQVRDLAAAEVEREVSTGSVLQGVVGLTGGGDRSLRLILPVLTTLIGALKRRKSAAKSD